MNILATYGAQHPGASHKVYLAIPLQQAFIRSYTLPWIPKQDRKSAISLLVDEEIAIARSDLLFDFLILSKEKHKNLKILLGASRQSLLEQYAFIFGRAGFKITGVDISLSILGQALGFEPNEDVLYLQGDHESIQMTLFRGAVPESVRSLNERAEEWENEVQRFLLYYRTQHPDLNLKRLVWNGDSVVELLAQGLLTSKHISVVEQAKLRKVPDSWQKVVEANKGWCEVAVGYGIRISAQLPALNLWRQPNTLQTVERRYQGLALFIAAVFMSGTLIGLSLYQRALPLQLEIQQLSLQGARIEAQVKHQEDLEAAWNKVKLHPDKMGVGLAHIQAMQNLPGVELKIEQVIYKAGSMSLRGSAKEASSVQTLINNLRTMGWEQPTLSSYKLTSLNSFEFSLSAKRGQVGTKYVDTMEDTPVKMPVNTDTSLGAGG